MTPHADDWHARVHTDPAIHHGEPCVKGTRVAISVIVASLADGDSVQDILESYSQLRAEDVAAALNYAAEAVRGYRVVSRRHAS